MRINHPVKNANELDPAWQNIDLSSMKYSETCIKVAEHSFAGGQR